jgi:hypothetical protein
MKQIAGFPQRLDGLICTGNNGSVEAEQQPGKRNSN